MSLFRKTKEEKLEKYYKGINAILTFPKDIKNNTLTKDYADYTTGHGGLAATCGTVNKKAHGKIQLTKDNLVFNSKETGELSIPYGDIDASNSSSNGIILNSGKKILINVYAHNNDIYDFIREFAKRTD